MVLFVQTSWQEQERILRAECQLLEARNVELEQQNKTLHAQMETVSLPESSRVNKVTKIGRHDLVYFLQNTLFLAFLQFVALLNTLFNPNSQRNLLGLSNQSICYQ